MAPVKTDRSSFLAELASIVRSISGFQASLIDTEERLVALNGELAEFWNTTPEQARGRPVLDFLYLGDKSPLIRASRTRQPVYELIHFTEARHRDREWVHTTAIPLYSGEKFLGTMTVGLPVTREIRAEGMQEALFHHPNLAVHLIDRDGTVVEANETVASWLGLSSREALIGRHLAGFFPPAYQLRALKSLADGRIRHQTVRWPLSSGPTFIDIFTTPVFDRGGTPMGALTVARDVSREVKTRETLARAWQLHAVGELAAKTTHEFRNCLALIRCTAQMGAVSTTDSESARLFAQIQQQVDATNSLITELLNLSLPAKGDPGPVNLVEVASQVARMLTTQLEQNRIVLEIAEAPEPPLANADQRLLRQALVNVLNNSIEALGPRGGRIELRVAPVGELVELAVSDDGLGLPAHIREHLYEPFYTTKEGGIGLGLSVVHQIVVDFHGGELELESPPGGGTTVRMRFPRAN